MMDLEKCNTNKILEKRTRLRQVCQLIFQFTDCEPAPPNFRVPFTIASSRLSENLEQARESLDPKEGRWDPCWVC